MYSLIIETLILVAVVAEVWLSYKCLQYKQQERVKRSVRNLLSRLSLRSIDK